MGRLQKKKTSHVKTKKKKQESASGLSEVKNNPAANSRKERNISINRSLTKKVPSDGKLAVKLNKGLQFLREVNVELKKVTWPTRKQTVGLSVVVIVLVLIISLFLGLIDVGLSSLIRLIL
ncbi:MAG: preprotein translocase subunit SecE [Desulfosarcina sp.]|nr:preprotein translocase subunit SecE [Desulfobacterales bacterium]